MRWLLLVICVSCGGGGESGDGASGSNAPVTSSPTPSPDNAAVEGGIRALVAFGDLATKHGSNCDALATDMAAYARREAPTLKAFLKAMGENVRFKHIDPKLTDRVSQVAKATMLAVREHCATHPAVGKMLKTLGT